MSVCRASRPLSACRAPPAMRRSPLAKVKRSLFGAPEPEEARRFLLEHLQADFGRSCAKWNFDFRDEGTLDPEGEYVWRKGGELVLVPRKRKVEVVEMAERYYFQPVEQVERPAEKVEVVVVKQTHITDYMAKSKRPAICTKDTPAERPKKIPKLTEFCSS